MGKRRKGGNETPDTWEDKSPQEKADWFDASVTSHGGETHPEPVPDANAVTPPARGRWR
jgi:hypothetical protein